MEIRQKTIRALVLASVVFTVVMLSIYVSVITFDAPFPIWNPSPKENVTPIILPYPDTVVVSMPGTDFVVKFTIKYSGILAENTPIQIVNASYLGISPEAIKISIGFPESILTRNKDIASAGDAGIIGWAGTWALSFDIAKVETNATTFVRVMPPKEMNEIYFPVAGDYSPIILVNKNGNSIQYTYEQIKVRVQSQSEVESANVSRLSLGLTWAFLGFSYIGVIVAVYELVLKEENKNQIENQLSEQRIKISPPANSPEKPKIINPNNKNTNGESEGNSEPKARKPRTQKTNSDANPE